MLCNLRYTGVVSVLLIDWLQVCCAITELAREPGSPGAGAVKNDLARVLANVLVITASMLSAKPPKFTKKVETNFYDIVTMVVSSVSTPESLPFFQTSFSVPHS